ncbi:hypothetical protein [Paenibacillus hamazuiensis]|uniref:hypothetical protein n=1 Tax=Paenibacillus hamazuiensis TaxID=2936508 RepID=UPI0020105968|nr:hypothetical protein [Paenibacillus hamazuiensis]
MSGKDRRKGVRHKYFAEMLYVTFAKSTACRAKVLLANRFNAMPDERELAVNGYPSGWVKGKIAVHKHKGTEVRYSPVNGLIRKIRGTEMR